MSRRLLIAVPAVAFTLAGCVGSWGARRAIQSFMAALPAEDDPMTDFYDYLDRRYQEDTP